MPNFYQIGTEQAGFYDGGAQASAQGTNSNANMGLNRISMNQANWDVRIEGGHRKMAFGHQGDWDAWTNAGPIGVYNSSGGLILTLETNSSGQIKVWDHPGNVKTLAHDFVGGLGLSGANDAFVMFVVDMDAGTLKYYKDNTLIYQWDSLDFTGQADVARMYTYWSSSMSGWFASSDDITEWAIKGAYPTADGTDVGGTGTYAAVDESTYASADYITMEAADKHSFVFSSRVVTGEKRAISLNCIARRTVTGPTQMRAYLIIGGTRYYGATRVLSESATAYHQIWNQNPATAADWTQAEVEGAIEGGWEAIA